ncbi:hypothetical protein I4U23_025603 [Adineta vaga]|nr:hypothetical protein I4U23_025603 [Adineta vaga]
MSQKKVPPRNNFSNAGKSKATLSSNKSKTVTKQTQQTVSPSSSSSSSNTAATTKDDFEEVSSMQNCTLFWLDANIDLEDNSYRNSVTQLRSIVSVIRVFNAIDECIEILKKIKKQKVLLVVCDSLGPHIVPRIHDMHNLFAIFMFSNKKSIDESWTTNWTKITGIFTDINSLCESVQQIVRQCEQDFIDISLFPVNNSSGSNQDQLDQSFMYTQLIKEIILELNYSDENIIELVVYCRKKYSGKQDELQTINEFRNGYRNTLSIWWYSRECFIYQMLNLALRQQELDSIIRMGFFIRDLLQQIEDLYKEQTKDFRAKLTLFRGQRVLLKKFEEMKKTIGGLISFNNFLSTSKQLSVAKKFANPLSMDRSTIAVLFIITVDACVSSVPFANIRNISYISGEEEILFSMNAIFRITDIKPSDENHGLWNVYLTATSDKDRQLNNLLEHMRLEIDGSSALYRLGALMMKFGAFKKAEEIYNNLLKQELDEVEKGNTYYQLGHINDNLGDYKRALDFYQQALKIYMAHLRADHPNIATCYNNIGLAKRKVTTNKFV